MNRAATFALCLLALYIAFNGLTEPGKGVISSNEAQVIAPTDKGTTPPGNGQPVGAPAAQAVVVSKSVSAPAEPQLKSEAPKPRKINWLTDLRAAYKLAAKDGKPILVHCTAVWCGPCRVLDREVFTDSRVIAKSADFHCVRIDTDKIKLPASWGMTTWPTDYLITMRNGVPKLTRKEPGAASTPQAYLNRLAQFERLAQPQRKP